MLHHFHVTCAPAVAGMESDTRELLMANVSCVAAEAFITCKRPDQITNEIVLATKKYYDEIRKHAAALTPPMEIPEAEQQWISFDTVEAQAKASAKGNRKSEPDKLLPKVITFDERTGAPIDAQDTREATKPEQLLAKIPWQTWLQSPAAQSMDERTAAVAAITLILRSMHHKGNVCEQSVDVFIDMDTNHRTAKAGEDLGPGDLELLPCVPATCKVHVASTHPHRVAILVAERDVDGEDVVSRSKTFYVHPEYKLPLDTTTESAVADGLDPRARIWEWTGEETLHPFWAIERMSREELQKKSAAANTRRAFNVVMTTKSYNVVTVGNVKDDSIATTTSVIVPIITNEAAIAAGEELLLESAARPAAHKRKTESWKDDSARVAKKRGKTPSTQVATPKAKACGGIAAEV